MAIFESRTPLECSAEAAFDFLIRPENSLAISPPSMRVTLESAPETIEQGSRVAIRVHVPGHAQRFVHEVTEFERPRRFVVRQVEGVFKHYVHEHLIEARGPEVDVIDRVDFAPPGGLLGFLLTERRIRDGLEATVHKRQEEMRRQLERSGS